MFQKNLIYIQECEKQFSYCENKQIELYNLKKKDI